MTPLTTRTVGSAVIMEAPSAVPALPPASVVPAVVTRRQAMRALYLTGKLDLVQPAITAIEDDQLRGLVQIDWDTAQEFRRDNGTLQLLAAALGLDSASLDALFTLAGEQPV